MALSIFANIFKQANGVDIFDLPNNNNLFGLGGGAASDPGGDPGTPGESSDFGYINTKLINKKLINKRLVNKGLIT